MPLYNFDPAEEEGDWESELLEEEKEQQVALHIRVGHVIPNEKFSDYNNSSLLPGVKLEWPIFCYGSTRTRAWKG